MKKKNRYGEALEYLYDTFPMFSRVGAPGYKPGLGNSLCLAALYDNPQKKFRSIHVGGTNGKGSTSHLIASILQSQGYRVGLYTSPHILDFRERIKINGEMISESKVVKFIEGWKEMKSEVQPSFFEFTMTMAFDWFANEKVDFAVIEVGMGGRLDSTNIIKPVLSVITNISHDHNQYLGNTLEEIAKEKAGIIKQGVPVVIGERQRETENVFIEKAKETGSLLVFADRIDDDRLDLRDKMPLNGDYQKKNLRTVLASVDALKQTGVEISNDAIRCGIERVCDQTGLIGRWMQLGTCPVIITDGGHNLAGLSMNFRQLEKMIKECPEGKLRIVIGMMADKAIDEIVRVMPREAVYYVVNANLSRALPAIELLEKMKGKGLECRAFSDVRDGFEEAKKESSYKDIIFVGGSFSVVGEFLERR